MPAGIADGSRKHLSTALSASHPRSNDISSFRAGFRHKGKPRGSELRSSRGSLYRTVNYFTVLERALNLTTLGSCPGEDHLTWKLSSARLCSLSQ
jgi:hypothetical protein